ncbi:MAG: hypothetical protein ACXVBW_07750 [Bdellovibrionota bacterium]
MENRIVIVGTSGSGKSTLARAVSLKLAIPRIELDALYWEPRCIRRAWTREKLWAGNRESLWRTLFTRDSMLVWVIQTHGRRRHDHAELLARPEWQHLKTYHLKSSREVRDYLSEITPGAQSGGEQNKASPDC